VSYFKLPSRHVLAPPQATADRRAVNAAAAPVQSSVADGIAALPIYPGAMMREQTKRAIAEGRIVPPDRSRRKMETAKRVLAP
jgi:hypothetical protein